MAEETKNVNKVTTEKAKQLVEFHFPGNGEFKPVTIKAENFDEAQKEWEEVREQTN